MIAPATPRPSGAAAAPERVPGGPLRRPVRIARAGRLGSAFLLAGAVATPWNAVSVGGLQPGDALFAAGLGLLLLAAVGARRSLALPWWVTGLATVAAIVAFAQVFSPVDSGYVTGRFVLLVYGGQIPDEPANNLTNLAHWQVALFALPLAAVLAARLAVPVGLAAAWPAAGGFVRKLATAWLVGCTISALVALSDRFGVTAISASLLPFTDVSGRQAGLTSQPNNLAVAAAMALPVAVYWATGAATSPSPSAGPPELTDRAPRVASMASLEPLAPSVLAPAFGMACVLVLLGGALVAGSRGGSAAAVLALLGSLMATSGGRKLLPKLLIATMIASPLLASVLQDTWSSLRESLRLGGEVSGAASDLGREMLARQAIRDFEREPLRGIGLWVITESHSIYLQLLASGGLLLLLAFVVFLVFAARAGLRSSRLEGDPLGTLLAVSMLTWALVGVVENQLTDRYLYVPAAALACLHQWRRGHEARRRDRSLTSPANPGVARIPLQPRQPERWGARRGLRPFRPVLSREPLSAQVGGGATLRPDLLPGAARNRGERPLGDKVEDIAQQHNDRHPGQPDEGE